MARNRNSNRAHVIKRNFRVRNGPANRFPNAAHRVGDARFRVGRDFMPPPRFFFFVQYGGADIGSAQVNAHDIGGVWFWLYSRVAHATFLQSDFAADGAARAERKRIGGA